MPATDYWADTYLEKRMTADEAMNVLRSGQRIFIGSACGEPQALVKALSLKAPKLSGLEVVRMMSHETISLIDIAEKTGDLNLNIRTLYLGSGQHADIARYNRFVTPLNMSDVPNLFKSRKLPVAVALIQVSPPDDFGWLSLGISVDVTLAAALSADVVVAQVNPQMPRVLGQSFIHVNDVDVIVEAEQPLISLENRDSTPEAAMIGRHIARLINDGSTLQIGLDAMSQATVQGLANKNDLGIHSQYFTDDMMHLYAKGIVTNRHKGFNEGKMVASAAIGTQSLYEFLNDNPAVDFRPSDYVNDPYIISRHNRMVSLNLARTMDLTGQVSCEASAQTFFAGVSGVPDFVRGARRAPGGKSILMILSTSADGNVSNILPSLCDTTIVVPRGDVHYVVSEYGAVNLFGKSLQERVMAMISIAHPKFRDELFAAAKEQGLIAHDRTLREAIKAIYPVRLEETIQIDGQDVTIRPAKPVDERRIQEHYYALDDEDTFSRFMHKKTAFTRSDVENKSQIDYVRDLTLVAIVGEFGFGRVVGVGECMLVEASNMAEVAFSVSKEYQGKGLGWILLQKLAQTARDNGVAGLLAFTVPTNRGMIKLFKRLPYAVQTHYDGGELVLQCRFDKLA